MKGLESAGPVATLRTGVLYMWVFYVYSVGPIRVGPLWDEGLIARDKAMPRLASFARYFCILTRFKSSKRGKSSSCTYTLPMAVGRFDTV